MKATQRHWAAYLLLAVFGLAAVLAPLLAPVGSVLGTDLAAEANVLGDTCSWWMWATRRSLALVISTSLIALVLGLPIGIVTGWNGELGDMGGSRALEFMGRVPSILLVGVLRFWDPTEGILALGCTLALLRTMDVVRLVRSQVASRANLGFVVASRALGGGILWRMKQHTLPGLRRPMLATLAAGASASLSLEAAFAYIGLGAPLKFAAWGGGLGSIQTVSESGVFWVAITSLVLCCLSLRHLARQWVRISP